MCVTRTQTLTYNIKGAIMHLKNIKPHPQNSKGGPWIKFMPLRKYCLPWRKIAT